MDADFWKAKWEKGEIAFHEREANPLRVKYFKELLLAKGSRVFVPLCVGETKGSDPLNSSGGATSVGRRGPA